ncbi:MAG: molybdopterin-dependent oxidoreductase [Firmicutes bacterium]|nr:molybdopterin-dependent oxidoreductase [Alicyclobacillaceae bacterium]MCL6497571.1 molybdopterin-dependent oxidoreductase [Bacillota bacterium]
MALDRDNAPADARSVRTVATTCYMCACRCGITVTVENERIRFIAGTRQSPVNRGVWCAKGGAGIMTQYSPARLTQPLMRRPGAERGTADFVPVDWETALDTVVEWLRAIRERDPKALAYFTGRDQMQAFNGYWAKQFGTPNWAAHGGFCSVNMAAAGMYSVGGSFWEFGWPDLERARWFMLLGVAEDHPSNPLKLAIAALKDRGGRFVAVNPVRTGYAALADEWVPIRPGTDGALLLAMAHVLWREGLYDAEFLRRYTNAPGLVKLAPGTPDDGRFLRTPSGEMLVMGADGYAVPFRAAGGQGVLEGRYTVDGVEVEPAFQRFLHRLAETTPAWAEAITGLPRRTIERLAREMGETALYHPITLPIPWTDFYGTEHPVTVGRPVAFHAMRGLAAHTNGFQTIRALFDLMMMLGTIDVPGGFRYKSPYPKPVPPPVKPDPRPEAYRPGTPAPAPLLGYPTSPDDLLVEGDQPLRIDEAYSWKYPLAAHGAIQNVIRNAHDGTPYPIDTLILYMANMAWNSSWNTLETRALLTAKDASGRYRIPHVVVIDAYDSETVAYADLVFPDTTYLERWDASSLQDRPISEPDGPADAIRQPVVPPPPGVRPAADTLIEIANRLGLPGFVEDGVPRYRTYADFLRYWETAPGSGVGLLAGFRGRDGQAQLVGEPNPGQLEAYAQNQAFWYYELPDAIKFYRMANRAYLEWATAHRFLTEPEPIVLHFYSEVLQTFRLAGQGLWPGKKPAAPALRERLARYFDPLPFWYPPFEDQLPDATAYPLRIITQRPMTHYHSWGSQNAWLRQLLNQNPLFMNPRQAQKLGLRDGQWVWIESRLGRMTGVLRYSEAVEPGTVWTWNAIAKAPGTWGLDPEAPEATRAILINHIIPDTLPSEGLGTVFNNDPITGQAGWYDTRVRVYPSELHEVWPKVAPRPPRRPEALAIRRLAHVTRPHPRRRA